MNIDARDFLEAVTGYANSPTSGAKSSSDRPVRLGSIDPNYTSGMPRVLFDGETQLSDRGYPWVQSYTPINGSRVFLIPVGQSYIIGGGLMSTIPYSRYIGIPLFNSWTNYDTNNYHGAVFTKTSTGLVKLSGLVYNGNQAQNIIVGKLPEGFRPNYTVVMPVMSNGTYGTLLILPTGEILTKGFSQTEWVALDNIVFPTAKLTWNSVTLLNGFTEASESYLGLPQYAKDAQGRVWFRGALGRASAPAADTPMFTIPTGYRPPKSIHLPASSLGDGTKSSALIDVTSSGDVRFKQDTASTSTISLGGVMYPEDSVAVLWTNATLLNGWTNWDTGAFTTAGYHQDSDGTVHLRGLVKAGGYGLAIFNLPAGMRPAKRLLRVTQSNNLTARIDIHSNGDIAASSGVAGGWVTLDGISFTPEQ